MDITLIRHGKTEANERRLYCGKTDLPLSENGIAALTELRCCKYPNIDDVRVYTSGMLRAEMTLDILYGAISHDTVSGMREMDFGRFEMHSYDELKEDAEYIEWITDTSGEYVCPGGESSALFKKRVFAAFDSLVENGSSALVVCHGGVIAEIMARLFPNEGKNFYEWQPGAGCGYTIRFDGASPVSYSAIPLKE